MSGRTETFPLSATRSYLYQASLLFLVLTGFFIPISITAMDVFMAAAAICAILSGHFRENYYDLKRNPIVLSLLAFVLITIIALTWSIAPWGDRLSALHKYSKLLYVPLLLPLCREEKWRDRTILGFLLGMLITVVISYLKALWNLPIPPYPDIPSFVFYTHIETGYLVAFATYLFAYYAWKKPKYRWICWLLVGLFTYQEFFINDGRTGWVAYLALLLLYAVHRIGWKGLVYGVLGAILLMISAYSISPTFKNTFIQSIESVEQYYHGGYINTSLGYRLSFIKLSWGLIKERPILGYGTGSFATAYRQSGGVEGWKRTLPTPHNEYLMVMVEFGLVGLFALFIIFYSLLKYSFKLGDMMYLAQALLLAFMISCCYNAFLYLTVSGHFFVLLTALFYGRYLFNDQSSNSRTS